MGARILIVEDNPVNMELMVYLLSAFGHQPLQAVDGEQGVAMARSELPDLILCDLHLPKLDGYGVLRQLKADPATRAIPVIATSALPADEQADSLAEHGFDGALAKALEPESFVADIERLLHEMKAGAGAPDGPEH